MGISVITVTNRHGGIDVAWSSLRRQTFKTFEWILYDTLYQERKDAVASYTNGDPRVVHRQQHPKEPTAKTWLAHAQNQAFLHGRGQLIVLLQDYIHVRPDALEKFWLQYQANPKVFVSGVGHQYGRPGKEDVADPHGLITVFKKPFERQPELIVWSDPRVTTNHGSYYPCQPNDWEGNWAMIPRQAIEEIGGWDESYDAVGHAWDNVSVAQRAFALGYEPYLDQSNESFSIRHDDFFDTTVKEHDAGAIAAYHQARMAELAAGRAPIKLPYLDNYRLTS